MKKREHISRKKMDNEVKYCQGRRSGEVEDFFSSNFQAIHFAFQETKKKKANESRSTKLARMVL